jgi:hypothetical protein
MPLPRGRQKGAEQKQLDQPEPRPVTSILKRLAAGSHPPGSERPCRHHGTIPSAMKNARGGSLSKESVVRMGGSKLYYFNSWPWDDLKTTLIYNTYHFIYTTRLGFGVRGSVLGFRVLECRFLFLRLIEYFVIDVCGLAISRCPCLVKVCTQFTPYLSISCFRFMHSLC